MAEDIKAQVRAARPPRQAVANAKKRAQKLKYSASQEVFNAARKKLTRVGGQG